MMLLRVPATAIVIAAKIIVYSKKLQALEVFKHFFKFIINSLIKNRKRVLLTAFGSPVNNIMTEIT